MQYINQDVDNNVIVSKELIEEFNKQVGVYYSASPTRFGLFIIIHIITDEFKTGYENIIYQRPRPHCWICQRFREEILILNVKYTIEISLK